MLRCKGSCLCGRVRFEVSFQDLAVIACHCTRCQKWSGGMAMYIETASKPIFYGSGRPAVFRSSYVAERGFCSDCGTSLFLHLANKERFFINYPSLKLSTSDVSKLVLLAEIYTESKPAFWGVTGQYSRFTGCEIEMMDRNL